MTRTAPNPSGHITRLAVERPLTTFFVLAYALSWLVFIPMIVFRWPAQFTILASFGPSLAALVTHRLATGSYQAFRFRSTWTRTLATTIAGVALIILAYVVLPGISTADPRKLNWSILTSLGVYNYSTLLGGPIGEEPGWRGYAPPGWRQTWALRADRCYWASFGLAGICRCLSVRVGKAHRYGSMRSLSPGYRSS